MSKPMRPIQALTALLLSLAGASCTVLTVEENAALKQRGANGIDPVAFVNAQWETKILPRSQQRAVPINALATNVAADLDVAGRTNGRRAGEGSPWTFAVKGTATVESVDRSSQRGLVTLRVAAPSGSASIKMQIGPYISGMAIRDSLDFISFNEFNDQLEYASVGNALTERALKETRQVSEALKPGDQIGFLAVTNIVNADGPIIITPVQLQRQR